MSFPYSYIGFGGISPPDPALQVIAQLETRDQAGNPRSGVVVSVQLVELPAGVADGSLDDGTIATYTTDGSGLLQLTLIRGATYRYWAGAGKRSCTIPTTDITVSSYNLPSIIVVDATPA